MSIVVKLTLKPKDEAYEPMRQAMASTLKDTAARDGAELISCAADPVSKTIVVWEVWDQKSSQEAYLAWRAETGSLDGMADMLREPPEFLDMDHIVIDS